VESESIVHVACACEQWRVSSDEEEGEEKHRGDRLRDGENSGGRSLSIVHMQREQWRVSPDKGKEKGKGKSSTKVMD